MDERRLEKVVVYHTQHLVFVLLQSVNQEHPKVNLIFEVKGITIMALPLLLHHLLWLDTQFMGGGDILFEGSSSSTTSFLHRNKVEKEDEEAICGVVGHEITQSHNVLLQLQANVVSTSFDSLHRKIIFATIPNLKLLYSIKYKEDIKVKITFEEKEVFCDFVRNHGRFSGQVQLKPTDYYVCWA